MSIARSLWYMSRQEGNFREDCNALELPLDYPHLHLMRTEAYFDSVAADMEGFDHLEAPVHSVHRRSLVSDRLRNLPVVERRA